MDPKQRPDADVLLETLLERADVGAIEIRVYKTKPHVVAVWRETQVRTTSGETLADVFRAILDRQGEADVDTQPIPRQQTDTQTQRIRIRSPKKPPDER